MSAYMIYSAIWMLVVVAAMWIAHPAYSGEDDDALDWLPKIRKDHPRLFFNAETWPAVKERALNQERDWYDRLKRRVDGYPEDPEVKDWGSEAAATAFVFRMTGEARYLELIKKFLHRSIKHYHARNAAGWAAHWYSTSRVNAWSAYDWVYNDLSEEERREIAIPFVEHVDIEQLRPGQPRFTRHNGGGATTGFYGPRNLQWFVGLALYDDGINDDLALEYLKTGYELNMELLEHRKTCAGEHGGAASASLNYAMGAYPWAEFNFFHTMESALGEDISDQWPHAASFPEYVIWNWLPGEREFGTGDSYHTTNKLSLGQMYTHMAQVMHFYGKTHLERAALARWMQGAVPDGRYTSTWPCHPFLLTRLDDAPPPQGPSELLGTAHHFRNMGQIFMRSGSGPDDTYALFTVNGALRQHKHFDNNNFTIFKKGFLALDTGTRPEPGQHLFQYYCRTVAHNCILIHMPDEELPRYWGSSAPGEEETGVVNDGGQISPLGSEVAAFETNPHFTYVAGDATKCYSDEKCKLALRQFVFIPPDYFVIFDRVTSPDPDYKKTWLLHTAREPEVEDMTFQAEQEEGRIICRTMLPENAVLTKIGGPGKQFWADGRNWPLPEGYRTPDTTELLGQWRMEVSPGEAREKDMFLHFIQVGDLSMSEMTPAELVREDGTVGVSLGSGESKTTVTFATEGTAAGHIRIVIDGQTIVDQVLQTQQ
ncbi:heparinase II/III family protein [Candidatus Poribacteria bacterium]